MDINVFNRGDWNTITEIGKIHAIYPVASHYVLVTYDELHEYGKNYIQNVSDDTKKVIGPLTQIGFSVNWYDLPSNLYHKCTNVYNVDTVAKGDLRNLNDCVKVISGKSKILEQNIDHERGSVIYYGDHEVSILIGKDVSYITVAQKLLGIVDSHTTRINKQRSIWYKWLSTATYTELKTGNVFKFPNNLSVKMDDGDEPMCADDYRIFCETRDHEREIERHETEVDFLAWLTRYF